ILFLIFFERSDPYTIALWAAVMLLLPAIGFFIYLCFGQTFYRRRHFAIKNLTDENLVRIKEESLKELSKKTAPENEEEMRFARSLMDTGGAFYSAENKLDLCLTGEEFFRRMFDDLKRAEKYIHAEYYIIRNDKLSNEFMDVLIEKAKAGLEVKLMVDAVGFNSGLGKRIKELRSAGGEFELFHRSVTVFLSPKKNNRNHRKLMVIDGTVGYVSGFNIGDEYLGKGETGRWRDTGLRIEGQSVIAINLRFFMDWGYASKRRLDLNAESGGKYFTVDESAHYGEDVMQLISGGPDTKNNPIELQYLKIIGAAKKTLYIHTPYLVPSDNVMKGLILSARSGVDVRIIMPDRPDHLFVYWVSVMNAGELMKNGVKVYRYIGGFVHSKTLVADGEYCSVGSANLDQRSMTLNFETNAMVYSKRIGEQMQEAFMKDLDHCAEYSLEEYGRLNRWQNFKMSVARLFSSWA
ncbi:MAG: cardiolipin synthase, partial [Methanomassiliicoccaceae archaeon]|nr:cardiolipin synthase [Methanomassiliicoccaceae archaeon]